MTSPPTAPTGPPRRTPRLVVALLVVAVVATPVLAFPYVTVDRSASRIQGQSDLMWPFLALGTVAFVLTGVPLALTTPDGAVTRFGVLVPALAWPVVAVVAVRAIRRRDVVRHREWMLRLYALTFFAITARMVTPLLLLLQVPVMGRWYDGDLDAAVSASIPYGQWLGWIVDLALAEVVIRRTRSAAAASA